MTTDEKLQVIVSQTAEVRDAVTGLEAALNERCPEHRRMLDDILVMINGPPGNGRRPGFNARLGTVEAAVKRIREARAWVYGVAGTVVGGAGLILLQHVVTHFK